MIKRHRKVHQCQCCRGYGSARYRLRKTGDPEYPYANVLLCVRCFNHGCDGQKPCPYRKAKEVA